MLKNKLLSAMSGSTEQIFSDDCFSTWLYTGNGSTQTITNGIDLAGKGGLVWTKKRSASAFHVLEVLHVVRGTGSIQMPQTHNPTLITQ